MNITKKAAVVLLVFLQLAPCIAPSHSVSAGDSAVAYDGDSVLTESAAAAYTAIAAAVFAVCLPDAERTAAILFAFVLAHAPSKALHYSRNALNTDLPASLTQVPGDWRLSTDNAMIMTSCHQFGTPQRNNIKALSPDGMREAVYSGDGMLITDPLNEGTFNFYPVTRPDPLSMLLHFAADIFPWLLWGNSESDTTTAAMRLGACFE